jgi:hypothetical protein
MLIGISVPTTNNATNPMIATHSGPMRASFIPRWSGSLDPQQLSAGRPREYVVGLSRS